MGDKRKSSDPRDINRKKKKRPAGTSSGNAKKKTQNSSGRRKSSQQNRPASGKKATQQRKASSSTKSSQTRRTSAGSARPQQKKKRKLRIGALLVRILMMAALVVGITYGANTAIDYFGNGTSSAAAGEESSATAESETQMVVTETTATTEEETETSTEEETALEDETGETEETQIATVSSSALNMVFAGDVWLEEIADAYDNNGITGILSDELLEQMQNADLTMINQEFPFGTGGTAAADKQYTFKVAPSYVTAFQDMGVDIVTLANNHTLDFGTSVLTQTFSTLDEAGIEYVGAGDTVERASAWKTFELGGKTVAVLGASRVLPTADWNVEVAEPGIFSTYNSKKLTKQIAAAKEENDLVIVYVHWGIEKSTYPEDYQRELAYEYADAGADLIVGAHPHVLQGIEYYNNTPIIYSLGNFMFHETISSTVLLRVDVDRWNNMSLTLIPAYAENSKTKLAVDEQAQEILQTVEDLSINVSVNNDGRVIVK